MQEHYPAPKTWHETKTLQHQMQRDLIRRAFDEHATREDAAKSIGMSWPAMEAACRRLDLPFERRDKAGSGKPKGYTADDYRRRADLGMSQKEAAQAMGVGLTSVSKMAKRHGIKFRKHIRASKSRENAENIATDGL